MNDKRGISGIVEAIIMIALVMIAAVAVWVVVNNMVKSNMDKSASCNFDTLQKVKLNPAYTCYDNVAKKLHFSISMGDIVVDEALISISSEGKTKAIRISKTPSSVSNIAWYDANAGTQINLPGKNSGETYLADLAGLGFGATAPDSVKIAPKISGQQCDVSDAIGDIPLCSEMA